MYVCVCVMYQLRLHDFIILQAASIPPSVALAHI